MKGWLGSKPTEHERVAELLSAYLDGRVDARERAQVDRHLETCADCRFNLGALRATVQAVRALPIERAPRSFVLPRSMARQPRPAWTFPVFRAATAMAAALLIIVIASDLAGLGAVISSYTTPRQAQPMLVAMEPVTPGAETRPSLAPPPQVEAAVPDEATPPAAAIPPHVEAPAGKSAGGDPTPAPAATPAGLVLVESAATATAGVEYRMVSESTTPTLPIDPNRSREAALPSTTAVTLAMGIAEALTATDTPPVETVPTGEGYGAQPPTDNLPEPTPAASALDTPAPVAQADEPLPTAVVQAEPPAIVEQQAAAMSSAGPQLAGGLLLRAAELSLAGLTLILAALALAASGRIR